MKKPKSLSANIASLLNSVPQEFDEDDELDDTTAKVLTADSEDSDQDEIHERSKIRAQNVDLLETADEKYAGEISTRKHLRDSDSDDELEEVTEEVDHSGSEENICEEEDSDGDNLDEESCDESEIEEGSDISNASGASSGEDDDNFKHFTESSSKYEDNKGQSVRNQLSIWESLLEIRIKSKKALSASNKMPVGEKFKEIFNKSNEENMIKLSQTKKSVMNLLEKMTNLQTLLLSKYPETMKLLSKKHEKKENEDDEEISSEVDSEDEPEIKRARIQDYGKGLSESHEVYRIYRNKIIEKWYDKTRIKHTESNSHTIVDQIDHILMDKSKLLKKTQLKRSDFRIIGETEKEEEEQYNVNIYDDEDFYHQQLRELVEFKTSDITDPLQLSARWVALQNVRSKMKRKIDTRATKGRKLRFGAHSKMVNLGPTQDISFTTEDAKREIYRSIFQKPTSNHK
ncbi:protein AATF [Coccinella septempunctata]|uniref:protein AATF n=1 Tax=Coccinella septempunctata TaxID=41139 RepID=UPI001D06AB4D|nr:protein AATF [Coccinella septempunctata]